jgi:DNA anti-recombination protein RmuC
MKPVILVITCVFMLFGCMEETRSTRATIDSTVNKLDSTTQKIGNKAEEVWDSTKSRATDLKKDLDKVFDKPKDTTKQSF